MPKHSCVMDAGIASDSQLKVYESTMSHGHKHTYRLGDMYSSSDEGHKHKISKNGKTLLKVEGHSHKLVFFKEGAAQMLREKLNHFSRKQLILIANAEGLHVTDQLKSHDLIRLIMSTNTHNIAYNV